MKKEIDNYIYEMYKKINIYEYLTPINLKEENKKFIEAYKNNKIYNPIYCYKKIDFDYMNIFEKLNNYKNMLVEKNYINKKILMCIEELEDNIKICTNIGNGQLLLDYSKKTYGEPSKQLLDNALKILNENNKIIDNTNYTSLDCLNIFTNVLERLALKNWKIKVNETQSSKVSVYPERKEITINKYAKFSKNDVKRLVVHEIGSHVLRGENGSNQPYKIFEIPLEKILETEEGLATVNEEYFNILDKRTFRIYAGRVLAVYENKEKSFYEIFKILSNYFSEEDALNITSRVKRGSIKTEEKGGWNKDFIYLKGYYSMKNYCNKNNKDNLYVGLIGYDEVDDCINYINSGKLNKPKILFSDIENLLKDLN